VHNNCFELPTQTNGYLGRRQQYKSYSPKSANVNKSLFVKSSPKGSYQEPEASERFHVQ
jgi:hypothetical protein